MKIGIYDPYLDTCGGGERYVLTLASYLSKKHEVDVFWSDKGLKKRLVKQFDLDLSKVSFCEDIFSSRAIFFSRLKKTSFYDLIFYLSDGSIPFSLAKKNILHFQVPFTRIKGKTFFNKLKLLRFQKVICNSFFTKKRIDETYGVKSLVIFPPVSVEEFKPLEKKRMILSVGRFTTVMHAKKQHVLVSAFKKMCEKGLEDWELILAGGILEGEEEYFEKIKKKAEGSPVKVLANVSFAELKKLYGQAKIYWHAAGFGEDLEKFPERAEHFGMTTVEAMAAGCVPVVFQRGGQAEIVKEGESGFFWKTLKELGEKTSDLIKNEELWLKVSKRAQKRSQKFDLKGFYREIEKTIK